MDAPLVVIAGSPSPLEVAAVVAVLAAAAERSSRDDPRPGTAPARRHRRTERPYRSPLAWDAGR